MRPTWVTYHPVFRNNRSPEEMEKQKSLEKDLRVSKAS
jgi:hypothetical protein